jgi:hypothetical protein
MKAVLGESRKLAKLATAHANVGVGSKRTQVKSTRQSARVAAREATALLKSRPEPSPAGRKSERFASVSSSTFNL